MNKLLIIFVTFVSFLGFSDYIFAEDEDVTTTSDITTTSITFERQNFIDAYIAKKEILEDLRTQTKTARDDNNNLVAQIKELIKSKEQTAIQTKITEVNALRESIKGTIAEAKTYVAERQNLRLKIIESLEKGNALKVTELNEQKNEVISKLNTYKSTLETNRSKINALLEELKTYREENKIKNQEIRALFSQTKTIHDEIIEENNLKNLKWEEFRASIGDKNYGKAIEAFDAIIASKTKILEDLKAKNVLLKEIISKYA